MGGDGPQLPRQGGIETVVELAGTQAVVFVARLRFKREDDGRGGQGIALVPQVILGADADVAQAVDVIAGLDVDKLVRDLLEAGLHLRVPGVHHARVLCRQRPGGVCPCGKLQGKGGQDQGRR